MTVDQELAELSKRAGALETYFKVALGIAAVFGVSGAFVLSQLVATRSELATLQRQASQLQPVVAEALAKIRAEGDAVSASLEARSIQRIEDSVGGRLQAHSRWIRFVYDQAAAYREDKNGANGWWQKALVEQSPAMRNEVN